MSEVFALLFGGVLHLSGSMFDMAMIPLERLPVI